MKKMMKRVLSLALCLMLALGTVGCGNSAATNADGSKELDMSKKVKMGVLVSDSTTAEALAFRSYFTEYIQKQYNVEFVYSDELKDAAGEKSAIDTFITNNCKAVISFSSFDRAAQLEQCAAAKVYYAVATGTLTAEEYEKYKENEYYVGAIGPSLDVEYEAGYAMAKHYLDAGKKNFAIFGGAVPYYTEMHIYRVAGMLTAMVDAAGDGANYQGATTKDEIIGKIFADGGVATGAIGDIQVLGYVGGYDMDEAWFAKCGEMVQAEGLEVVLAVGNGSDFFGTAAQGTDVKIASVDAYASSYGEAMAAGMLDYLAGKFSASIGPIFAATYSAVLGAPIRTEEGNALALAQGYWVAKSAADFDKFYALDSSLEAPAYDKAMLDTLIGSDYKTFADFVAAYTFEEIETMKK